MEADGLIALGGTLESDMGLMLVLAAVALAGAVIGLACWGLHLKRRY